MHPQSIRADDGPAPVPLTDEEFAALYPTTPNPDLARMIGRPVIAVTRRASALGLKKDPTTRYAHVRHPRPEGFGEKVAQRNKERVWTTEQREKLSQAHSGKVLTEKHRARISEAQKGKPKPAGFGVQVSARQTGKERPESMKAKISGENHYNWKGGVSPKPFEQRSDTAYEEWRNAVLARDNYICQHCERVFIRGQAGMHAHHIKEWHLFPDERYAVDNGITLCVRCHNKLHRKKQFEQWLDKYERVEQVPCACGCGELMYPIGWDGKPRRYLKGHVRRGATLSPESREKIRNALKGQSLTEEQRRTLVERNRSPEYRAHMSAKMQGREPTIKGWQHPTVSEDDFKHLYPTMSSRQLAAYCERTESWVSVWAKKLGLPPRYNKK